ncbi:hypothetical protein [Pseudomonas aeruginosa]|uniref:hypothetical protein n=1 Tax=Pseudomonas aeruginosa TaxID=287 RepID=UPI000EACA923|nr:hypothetical protein [Pseudomonas aeruginosa]
MTKANECTCPSGDGSLRHPCPAHPAVEQAVGDERAAFRPAQVISYRPGVGEVTIYVAGRVPGYMNIGDTVYVSDRAPVEQPSAALAQPSPVPTTSGYDQLWGWFGLSRSAYAVLPRVMMHAMPDDWQRRFAELMDEWDDHWPNQPDITAHVQIKQNNRFISTPPWLLNYRHPDHNQLNAMRGKDEL